MSEGGLAAVFRPRSVVVIGASSDVRKRGYQVLRALAEADFKGAVYPLNPRGGEIEGRRVYPSIAELPEVPDLALVCLPSVAVPDVVAECGRAGIGAAVVLAVGFGESGEEGQALAERLLSAAHETGIRVVGPNTSGLLNLPIGLNLIGARGVRAGGLSLVVQSGNVALSFMNEVTARTREGVAICVGVGNELDVGFHEYVDFLGEDPATRAIVAYSEGMADARAFLAAASRVGRKKPVLLLKGARSESGRAAARSHTGAVSGEYDLLKAGLAQAGVVEVTRSDELVHLAEALANQPSVEQGLGVAILSDGGGQGTLASDTLSDLDIPMAVPGVETQAALRELLGRAAAVRNPVDLAGAADGDPEVFARALEVLIADPAVGGVLVVGLFGGYGIRFSDQLAEGESMAAAGMARAARASGKPLVLHSMYASHWSAPLEVLGDARVPVIESLDIAVRCLAELWRRGEALARPAWSPEPTSSPESDEALASIAAARSDGRDTLTEPEAAELLAGHGMAFPDTRLCASDADVTAAFDAIPAPVVMKAVSAKIPHKTEAGGVALGIRSAEEARTAFRSIVEATDRYLAAAGLPPGIEGVMVAPMLPAPLAELLVGARRDAQLGPVLTVGTGGVWVEVLKDVTHRVLPVSDADIRVMVEELRTHGLLVGARGRASADMDAVVQSVRAVADCIEARADVADVEVNPLFVYPDRAVAVDARVFLTPVESP